MYYHAELLSFSTFYGCVLSASSEADRKMHQEGGLLGSQKTPTRVFFSA
jgi:hypothetical protein